MRKLKEKRPADDLPPQNDASDADAFALEMADVVRIRPDAHGRVRSVPPITGPPAATRYDDRVDGEDGSFVAPGVDRREVRKLRRGAYAVGESHDLHRMTAAAACASTGQFIERSRHDGHRCVCIVHGRGLHSEGHVSILKARVRAYLRSHRSVLAYANAPPSDGGVGAVYVLLRK